MRVVFYWGAPGLSLNRNNPYGALFARAMARLGVEVIAGYDDDLNENWLVEHRHDIDVLHLHWPHYMYDAPDLAIHVARCARLVGDLARARLLGYKIVWTVHNLYPHESRNLDLDRLARLAIASMASALITHCERARTLVHEHFFRRDGVFVIPHGSFIGAYPNTLTREEARRRLGLADQRFVYLFFGAVRPYKGLERLLKVFSELPGENLTLLVAARVNDEYSASVVELAKQAGPRVVVRTSQFFPTEDLQLYFNAADVVVQPFDDILTSGSAITALSFGRPIIVPAIGCLPETVHESMGVVYDPHQPDALALAMKTVLKRDLATLSTAAYNYAASLSWDVIARLTIEAYCY